MAKQILYRGFKRLYYVQLRIYIKQRCKKFILLMATLIENMQWIKCYEKFGEMIRKSYHLIINMDW